MRLQGRAHSSGGALFRLSVLTAMAAVGAMLAAVANGSGSAPARVVLVSAIGLMIAVAVVAGRQVMHDHIRLLAPAVTLLAVVGIRHAAGADGLRYELLLLVPVLWLALQGSLAELVVAVAGLAVGMVLLNSSGDASLGGWTDQALFVMAAGVVGGTVHQLIGR